MAEQAKFAATNFAPAVAQVKSNQITRGTTLSEQLNQLDRDKMAQGQGIYQTELGRDEQTRQFEQNAAFQREQAAAAVKAAAASTGYSFGGSESIPQAQTQPAARTRPGSPQDEQWAFNSIATQLSKGNDKQIMSDYLATAASAKNGNVGDLYKLQMYRAKRPDLFKAKYSWEQNYGF